MVGPPVAVLRGLDDEELAMFAVPVLIPELRLVRARPLRDLSQDDIELSIEIWVFALDPVESDLATIVAEHPTGVYRRRL